MSCSNNIDKLSSNTHFLLTVAQMPTLFSTPETKAGAGAPSTRATTEHAEERTEEAHEAAAVAARRCRAARPERGGR